MIKRIDSALKVALMSGSKLVFLDETIFSFSTYQKKSWSPKGTSLEMEEKKFNMIPQALIMGVSLDKGIDLCHINPKTPKPLYLPMI
jgi:hypothetical protein